MGFVQTDIKTPGTRSAETEQTHIYEGEEHQGNRDTWMMTTTKIILTVSNLQSHLQTDQSVLAVDIELLSMV